MLYVQSTWSTHVHVEYIHVNPNTNNVHVVKYNNRLTTFTFHEFNRKILTTTKNAESTCLYVIIYLFLPHICSVAVKTSPQTKIDENISRKILTMFFVINSNSVVREKWENLVNIRGEILGFVTTS